MKTTYEHRSPVNRDQELRRMRDELTELSMLKTITQKQLRRREWLFTQVHNLENEKDAA